MFSVCISNRAAARLCRCSNCGAEVRGPQDHPATKKSFSLILLFMIHPAVSWAFTFLIMMSFELGSSLFLFTFPSTLADRTGGQWNAAEILLSPNFNVGPCLVISLCSSKCQHIEAMRRLGSAEHTCWNQILRKLERLELLSSAAPANGFRGKVAKWLHYNWPTNSLTWPEDRPNRLG